MRSSNQNHFAQIPSVNIPRSSFDRSSTFKTTFDAGYLVPIFWDEALPGDTFKMRVNTFARLATPIVPFMDSMFCDVFFFFVPNRLLWDNWQKFCGEQVDPGDSTDFLVPEVNVVTNYGIGSLADYFGLPVFAESSTWTHSALPFRAYNLIYNEWFRDQNLQDSVDVNRGDGPDDQADYQLLRRGKRHDYFTSCLPWPQKGPAVPFLAGEAPLRGKLAAGTVTDNIFVKNTASGGAEGYLTFKTTSATPDIAASMNASVTATQGAQFQQKGDTGMTGYNYADLSQATLTTINQLRQAFQLQRLYERDARGGTRYTEIIRSHFGVISPDARLQRPEYLGGGSTPIRINPIAQTSSTDPTTPQGNLAAFGTFGHNGIGFTKSFTEHGIIIGLMSVRAALTYQNCLNRAWSRRTRWDYYWPTLAHIGEQAVLNKEIFMQGNSALDNEVFGYQERFAEYRYRPSQITGLFRSQAPTGSLDIWHLAQDFETLPVLNSSFIEENPPVDRVIATPDEPHFLFDSYFEYRCARPMPTYSVPGLVDHF